MPIHTVARPGGLTAGVGGVVVAPRSQPYVLCGDAHGWNVNGFDARLRWPAASLVQLSCSCLVLLRGCWVGVWWWERGGGWLLGGCQARCWVLRDHVAGWCGVSGGPRLVRKLRRFPAFGWGVVWVWVVWVWCCSYVENCIVDASIFEFLWSSC